MTALPDIDSIFKPYSAEYEEGVEAGRRASLDNIDAIIEEKVKANDIQAVELLQYVKTRL